MFNNTQLKIFHALQWRLVDIESNVPTIANQGFNAIQISPIQGTKEDGYAWWLLYQPTNLKIGNKQIGTKKELISLCKTCKKYRIKVIVDVVLRHVAGDAKEHYKPHEKVDPELLPYIVNTKECQDYNNRWDSTHLNTGMPMLNYDNPEYQHMITRFLNELKDCGVDGFRLDQLKHYALPEEGSNIMHIFEGYEMYGECIMCDQDILDSYTKYMDVLTEGRPKDTSKLIAKFESHDDYLEFGWSKRLTDDMRLDEWNVLINQCKYSAIFYVRPMNEKGECDELWRCDRMRQINGRGNV